MKISLRQILLTATCLLLSILSFSQKKAAYVSGKVVDENENPLPKVSVVVLGQSKGITTNDSGYFRIKVAANKAFALIFTYTGRRAEQKNFLLSEEEEETITIRLEKSENTLQEVIITDQRDRREVGLIRPNPKTILNLPSAVTGVESLIKIFVGSNNELTSQYSVRGGSYDENLIYVNDFEVFRPYLVRSGQQEGLSFINPEMVRNISFYNGGFQAKYGDKMSSVLDIQYKKPKRFGGSAYVGILEQGLQLEGTSKNSKFSYLLGVRNRSNRNLLSRQDTKGNYVPSSADFQALLNYQFSPKWQAELLSNISQTKFTLIPEFSQLTTSVFSPLYSATIGVDIYFEGREKDRYQTNMLGFSLINQPSKKLKLKWMASRFENDEAENVDIIGAYLFGDRDFDKRNPTYGLIVNPLGAGVYQNWARNELNIENWNVSHKGNYDKGKHAFQWGIGYDKTTIADKLNEWEFQDSAGYALPYQPNMLQLSKVIKSNANLAINKFSGYLQDNILLGDSSNSVTLTGGVRFNYNSLNQEFLITPRISASWKPRSKKDIIFRAAAGVYHQPPFYRELRRYNGTVNTNLQSQKSWQTVAGFDYNFIGIGGRPMRWTTEAYYKSMTDVVPYDVDNVRIRYFGENNAKAYATGIEMRLHGELVPDAESWISLGIMKTAEDISGDHYYRYKNAAGEFINAQSPDQVVVDSTRFDVGWLRRPTDRRITFGMYFQDYLPTNKNFKMFLNLLYGSNLPYNIPGAVRYRNAAVIEPYIRADIGFSALLVDDDRSKRRSHSPFRNFDNIWASLEVFNIIDRANVISYLFVKDFSNTVYLMPNRLTPRLVNFKIVARW
ncbi:MAG TPA: TonB-dependent receptor [Chitinophagaceae bacterium]|nr:TonB-dependent receptor [Chitinophagaceae bacterium]HQX71414.1 TonB-dependent receptor [Chitinophagaceae bacterium]